jgi:hypothetical protein
MNSFNNSFVSEMTKLAKSGSGMSSLAKALAVGGAGAGAYGLYKAHAANQAAQAAQAAAAAQQSASSRRRNLLGLGLLGLLGGGAAAAHHSGLDASIMEKIKGLFGDKASTKDALREATSDEDIFKPQVWYSKSVVTGQDNESDFVPRSPDTPWIRLR